MMLLFVETILSWLQRSTLGSNETNNIHTPGQTPGQAPGQAPGRVFTDSGRAYAKATGLLFIESGLPIGKPVAFFTGLTS